MSTEVPAADSDPRWGFYAETILEITLPEGLLTVDLRQPVGATVRAELARHRLGRPFAILTACDPLDVGVDAAENARRTEMLERRVAWDGALLARVTGRSPDGAHAEPGFACAYPREVAIAVAREWAQAALFWYDGARFWLIGACVPAADTPLPV